MAFMVQQPVFCPLPISSPFFVVPLRKALPAIGEQLAYETKGREPKSRHVAQLKSFADQKAGRFTLPLVMNSPLATGAYQ